MLYIITLIIAAGVFRFQHGHPVMQKTMEYLASKFDGRDWGANGPKAITNVMYDLCKVKDAKLMSPEKCLGIQVFPPSYFYKIPWRKWNDIFDSSKTLEVIQSLKESYVLHTWGRFSSNFEIDSNAKKSAFLNITEMNCPISNSFL